MDLELSEASGVPFYRQIKEQLAKKIKAGLLEPGVRLPSVRELASDLLVSLITVRRAYADLEAERLIVRRQGQGTYVSQEAQVLSHEQMRAEGKALCLSCIREARALGLELDELVTLFEESLRDYKKER